MLAELEHAPKIGAHIVSIHFGRRLSMGTDRGRKHKNNNYPAKSMISGGEGGIRILDMRSGAPYGVNIAGKQRAIMLLRMDWHSSANRALLC
jgi:hypothetical protein